MDITELAMLTVFLPCSQLPSLVGLLESFSCSLEGMGHFLSPGWVDFRGRLLHVSCDRELPLCDSDYHQCLPFKVFMRGMEWILPDTEEGAIPQLHCLARARTKAGSEGDEGQGSGEEVRSPSSGLLFSYSDRLLSTCQK